MINGTKDILDTDENISPILKMCHHMKNISYSLELLDKNPLELILYLKVCKC